MRLPVRKMGLKTGDGWVLRCTVCARVMLFISGEARLRLPVLCATCRPTDELIEERSAEARHAAG